MILGLDIDNVVADYIRGFRRFVADRHKIFESSLLLEEVDWHFSRWGIFKSPEETHAAHLEAVSGSNLFRRLPAIEGSMDGIRSLSEHGVRIRLITSRLQSSGYHPNALTDTAEWLADHAVHFDDICFVSDKQDIAADLYVDDSPSVAQLLSEASRPVLLYDYPHNSHVAECAHIRRVSGWSDIVQRVLSNQ